MLYFRGCTLFHIRLSVTRPPCDTAHPWLSSLAPFLSKYKLHFILKGCICTILISRRPCNSTPISYFVKATKIQQKNKFASYPPQFLSFSNCRSDICLVRGGLTLTSTMVFLLELRKCHSINNSQCPGTSPHFSISTRRCDCAGNGLAMHHNCSKDPGSLSLHSRNLCRFQTVIAASVAVSHLTMEECL